MVRLYKSEADRFPLLRAWVYQEVPELGNRSDCVDSVVRASGASLDDVSAAFDPQQFSPVIAVSRIAPRKARAHPTVPICLEIEQSIVDRFVAAPEDQSAHDALLAALLVGLAEVLKPDARTIFGTQIEAEVFGAPLRDSLPLADGGLTNREFPGTALTNSDLESAAQRLDLPAIGLWTVLEVEVLEVFGTGFDDQRRPQILFERHKFSKGTDGVYDKDYPNISAPTWGGYGAYRDQYDRLRLAHSLAPEAALKACSWGVGQVLGENFSIVGYDSVHNMVARMIDGEAPQLDAMVTFVEHENLAPFIKQKNWDKFARKYNGPSYKQHDYDDRLKRKYEYLEDKGLPDLDIRKNQTFLFYLGIKRGPIDGRAGKKTKQGIETFQAKHLDKSLKVTGELDAETRKILASEVSNLTSNQMKSLL